MPKFISISCLPLPTFVQGGYAIFDEGEKHPDRDNLQYFVLFTIVKGSLYIAEDGTNYTLKPGDTFLLLPQHHHYSWKKIDQRTEYYWIHFSVLGSWTEDERPHQMAPNIAIPKQHYFTPAVTLVIKKWQQVDTAPLIPLIDRLLKYSSEQNSVGFWQSQQLFIDIIQFVQYALPSVSSTEQLGNRVKSYLINHFSEPVTNQVLQERFHLHPNSITRKFEAEFYMTPKQYLNNYRLMEGARRLRTTGPLHQAVVVEVLLGGHVKFRLLKYSSEQNSVGFWQSQQLFIDIIQFVQYALPSVSSTEQLGNRVKSYLINHFSEPVTNQVLQERFHLHPNSITRKFEAEFYMTPKQYLNNYRLMEGARRLRTTGQSVARIAEEVGYQNVYYFSKQFKKKFNCSPSEYRQQTPQ